MPEANFDKNLNLPSGKGQFIKLSKKGDKLKFVIAATPHYQTRHWINQKPVVCGKYNSDDREAECEHCDEYEKLVAEGVEKNDIKIKPSTTFYYPILNLDLNKAQIFEFSAKSIHYSIKRYADEGIDVFGGKWSVERTEEQGNYYPLLYLGPATLNTEQEAQLEIAKKFQLSAQASSSVKVDEGKEEDEEHHVS